MDYLLPVTLGKETTSQARKQIYWEAVARKRQRAHSDGLIKAQLATLRLQLSKAAGAPARAADLQTMIRDLTLRR